MDVSTPEAAAAHFAQRPDAELLYLARHASRYPPAVGAAAVAELQRRGLVPEPAAAPPPPAAAAAPPAPPRRTPPSPSRRAQHCQLLSHTLSVAALIFLLAAIYVFGG